MSRHQHSTQTQQLLDDLRMDELPPSRTVSLLDNGNGSFKTTLPRIWLERHGVDFDEPGSLRMLYQEDEGKIVIDLSELNSEG